MYLVIPNLLCIWSVIGFTRAENTSKTGNETNTPKRLPFGRRGFFGHGFFIPRPGSSIPGADNSSSTDVIIIEHTDKDNSTTYPFIPRQFSVNPPRVCPKKRSCLGRCTSTRQFQSVTAKQKPLGCFCDPECNTVFQDCCADYERYCGRNGSQNDTGVTEAERWDCGKIEGMAFGLWMIATCPQNWSDDDIRLKCENVSSKIVLQDTFFMAVDHLKNVYRNPYCAKCNRAEKFTCWTVGKKNSTSKEISFLQSRNENCPRISLNTSSLLGVRYCYEIQTKCMYMDKVSEMSKCRDGITGLVSFKNKTYKNAHCLKCNHRTLFGFVPPKVWCGPVLGLEDRINFADIFGKLTALSTGIDSTRCSPGFLYDQIAQTCRKLLTISETNLTFLTKYAVQLFYARDEKFDCFEYWKNARDVITRKVLSGFREAFERRVELNLAKTNWKLSDLTISVVNENYTTVTFHALAIKSESNETDLFSLVRDLNIDRIYYLYNPGDDSSLCLYALTSNSTHEMKCINQNESNVAITMDNVSISNNGTLLLHATGERFKPGEYVLYKDHNQTRLATCKKSLPTDCKYFLKEKSHWKMFSNQSIYSDVTNMWFDFGKYSILDRVLWLCLKEEGSKNTKKENLKTLHETILRYSTLFCLSVSIFSIVVLLVVYSICPALRTLPGKNLMLLSSVLALAQFLWLLQQQASDFHKLCVAFSLVLHFLFLASFTSSTSFAVLSFVTFHNIAKGKFGKSSEGKAFLRCAVFSLGFPFVWVMVFGFLDYSGAFLLGYGKVKGLCWLGNVKGFYVAFFVPLFALLFVNLWLLLATVNVIQKCSKSSQKLVDTSQVSLNRCHVWIYIRLSTLMGFTWLFGVFQLVFPDVIVFQYLFVFVNGLQGFYIALAFLCTDNVRKILNKKVGTVSIKTKSTSR